MLIQEISPFGILTHDTVFFYFVFSLRSGSYIFLQTPKKKKKVEKINDASSSVLYFLFS